MIDFEELEEVVIPNNGINYSITRIVDAQGRTVWQTFFWEKSPFYIRNTGNQDANIYIKRNYTDSSIIVDVEVSNNGRWWTSLGNTGNNLTLNIPAGKKRYLRATGRWANANYHNSITGDTGSGISFAVGGNIMSLLYGSSFTGNEVDLLTPYTFAYLFYNWTSLKKASGLYLKVKTPTYGHCYEYMFYNCTALTSAPQLQATSLTDYIYQGMFAGCTSLVNSPNMKVETLAEGCYLGMFRGCSSLKYIHCSAYFQSNHQYTTNWVDGVAASGKFYKNANMAFWTTGVNGIPSGWTVADE